MGAEITQRHNAVLTRLAHFARMLNVEARIEPAGLHPDDRRRPDIQLDLPDGILLGDGHYLSSVGEVVAQGRSDPRSRGSGR